METLVALYWRWISCIGYQSPGIKICCFYASNWRRTYIANRNTTNDLKGVQSDWIWKTNRYDTVPLIHWILYSSRCRRCDNFLCLFFLQLSGGGVFHRFEEYHLQIFNLLILLEPFGSLRLSQYFIVMRKMIMKLMCMVKALLSPLKISWTSCRKSNHKKFRT